MIKSNWKMDKNHMKYVWTEEKVTGKSLKITKNMIGKISRNKKINDRIN